MRKVTITLIAGIALIAIVAIVTLTRSPPRVVRAGQKISLLETGLLANISSDTSICQPHEVLPAGVSAIRLGLWGFYGAHVHVRVYSGSQLLTEGQRGPDWTSDSVTVPVTPVSHTTADVEVCFTVGPNSQPIMVFGAQASKGPADTTVPRDTPVPVVAHNKNELLKGRVGVEYLASGASWWSQLLPVARRMGLGRSYTGTWIALLVVALMASIGVLAVRQALRELP